VGQAATVIDQAPTFVFDTEALPPMPEHVRRAIPHPSTGI
jgi:hypothetical protein